MQMQFVQKGYGPDAFAWQAIGCWPLYHIQLVLDEKAQPDSYIRSTALQGARSIFEKIKGFSHV